MAIGYLRIFIAFSCYAQNRADSSENTITSAKADRDATDGELFLKRIINGEKISEKPGYLIFTAPYRLCKGGCKDKNNFAMAFPLFIGTKMNSQYQKIYPRDYITANNKNAPFKSLKTRVPYTTCSTPKASTLPSPDSTTTTETPHETDDMTVETSSTALLCPKLAKCKPKKHKLEADSAFRDYLTSTYSQAMQLRSTVRSPWLRSQQHVRHDWNDYEARPYRTFQDNYGSYLY